MIELPKKYLPSAPGVSAEIIAVLLGTIGAAFIISKFPKLKNFVLDNSVTVRVEGGPFINET